MLMIRIVIIVIIALILFSMFGRRCENFVPKSRRDFENYGPESSGDTIYSFLKGSCKEYCMEIHPEAARMYDDEDNIIATTTIDACVKQCESMGGKN